jgi:hypothetical protein
VRRFLKYRADREIEVPPASEVLRNMGLKVTVTVSGVTAVQSIGAVSAFIVSLGFVPTDYLPRADSFSAARGSMRPVRSGYEPGINGCGDGFTGVSQGSTPVT